VGKTTHYEGDAMAGQKRVPAVQILFGERLRELRLAKGLSQEQLAFNCELDRSYVGQVERGERNISLVNICKLAAALNLPPSELLMPPSTFDAKSGIVGCT
jgi:transcriptional regulator with XRE-family HTH domain